MHDRPGQCQHVDDLRQVGQPVDVHRLVVDAGGAQQRQQCGELCAAANEHHHVVVGVLVERFADDAAALLRFVRRVGTEQRVNTAIALGVERGNRLRVRHRAARRVVRRRQHLREHRVEPVHEELAGTEVAAQHQGLEVNAADARALRKQELRDLGVAEAVDRLHGVADAEQGAAVARLPAPGQRFEHAVLGARRILHLVDEQVPDLVVEEQCDIAGTLGRTQRRAGCQRDLDEVGQALRAEQAGQFGDRVRQQAE